MKKLFTVLSAALLAASSYSLPKPGKSDINEIISAMTLEEKVRICMGTGNAGDFSRESTNIIGIDPKLPFTTMTFPIKRLGIPSIHLADGPAGLRVDPKKNATAFPCASVMAQSFDRELEEKIGEAMGKEAAAFGIDVILAPAMNIQRNPLGGRNFEYFSEDPVLSGSMAASLVKGIQKNNVAACVKHFICNNQESYRLNNSSQVSEKTLEDIYLKNFHIAIKESNPWCLMTSYNKLNGEYTSESEYLNNEILRNKWNYTGTIMTDWHGGMDAVAQIKASQNLLMPGIDRQYMTILKAVKNGQLSEEVLNENVKYVLNLILKTKIGVKKDKKVNLKENYKLSRTAAAESMVLLKNDGMLPVSPDSVSIWPPENRLVLFAGGKGSGEVNAKYTVNLDEGLKNAGFTVSDNGKYGFFVINRNSAEFKDRYLRDFYLSDEEKAALLEMSEKFHQQGKKICVILNVPGPVEVKSWINYADAVLLAGYAGQEIGNAICDIITGKVNPSGALAQTYPVDYFDLPSANDFPYDFTPTPQSMINRNYVDLHRKNLDYTEYTEENQVGYRYFYNKEKNPMFYFGYGLSYTTFSKQIVKTVDEDSMKKITVKVKNTGSTAGKTPVLIYSIVFAPKGQNDFQMEQFGKTKFLNPGEEQELVLCFPKKESERTYFLLN